MISAILDKIDLYAKRRITTAQIIDHLHVTAHFNSPIQFQIITTATMPYQVNLAFIAIYSYECYWTGSFRTARILNTLATPSPPKKEYA